MLIKCNHVVNCRCQLMCIILSWLWRQLYRYSSNLYSINIYADALLNIYAIRTFLINLLCFNVFISFKAKSNNRVPERILMKCRTWSQHWKLFSLQLLSTSFCTVSCSCLLCAACCVRLRFDNWCVHTHTAALHSPVRHCLLLFEYIAYFIAIEYKQQIRMSNETAHLCHFAIVHMQLVHHLVEVANFVGAWDGREAKTQ